MHFLTFLGLPKLDIEDHLKNYTGHGKTGRLVHIIKHSSKLKEKALNLLIVHLKNASRDTRTATAVMKLISNIDPDNTIDCSWIQERHKDNMKKKVQLDIELNNASAQVYTNSMASSYEELAKLAYEMGDFSDAQSYIAQKRDVLSESGIDMVYQSALVAYFAGRESTVKSYSEKVLTQIMTPVGLFDDNELHIQLGILSALANLKLGNIRHATCTFLCLPAISVKKYGSELVSIDDLTLYISLGALATFTRSELAFLANSDSEYLILKEISNGNFSNLLAMFLQSSFTDLFTFLNSFKTDFLLDNVLHGVMDDIYLKIRTRCFIQYLSVYSTVKLEVMSATFGLNNLELENEIKKLLELQNLELLIDQKNGVSNMKI